MELVATQTNIKSIVEKQRAYFKTGVTKDVDWRIKQIKKLVKLISDNESKVCEALKKDLNKPAYESLSVEIGPIFADASHILKHIREWAKPEDVETSLFHLPGNSKIYKDPYGNVLLISPWNYPFLLTIAPLIGAMSAGNCVLIKPSEHSPATSKLMEELINQNFDEGFIHVVQGEAEVTTEILKNRWDYIFFTGGTEIGRIIYQAAAKFLTPVTLELGGKSPCVVDKSAFVDLASKRIAWGKTINSGQTCIAPDYLFVHADVKDKFIEALKKNIKNSYGDSPIEHPDYCKIINQRQYDRLKGYLGDAEIIAGGKFDDSKQMIEPTVMLNPPKDSKVMTEEIFGPILPIFTYTNLDEVIDFINEREKPLASYIFSNNAKVREKFLSSTSSGGACVNDTVLHISSSTMPFGGVGESGTGGYHGKSSFDTFTHQKSVMHRMPHMLDPFLRYAPYSPKEAWPNALLPQKIPLMERIEQLREMLGEDANDPFLHYALGLELAKKKNYQEAMASFLQTIKLDENYVAAYYQLGILYIEIDIVDVARTYVQKGIEKAQLKKDFKSKGELEELLEGIE